MQIPSYSNCIRKRTSPLQSTKSQYKYERGTYNNLLKFAFSRMTVQFPCLVTSPLSSHCNASLQRHTRCTCKAIEKIQLTRTKLKCIPIADDASAHNISKYMLGVQGTLRLLHNAKSSISQFIIMHLCATRRILQFWFSSPH